MAGANVNLLHPVVSGGREPSALVAHLRLIGWAAISIFLIAGLVGFVFYFTLGILRDRANVSEKRLEGELRNLGIVEGLQTVVSSRLQILSRVIASQTDYRQVFDLVSQISPDEGISGIVVDRVSGRLAVKLTPRSIVEANSLVALLIALNNDRLVSLATLDSLTLGTDGTVTMAVSFVPTRK